MEDSPLRRSTDFSGADGEHRRAQELERVAATAARAAAELVGAATIAAAQVTTSAASAAQALQKSDLEYIKHDIEEIKRRLDSKFVSVEAFEPIRKLVHGLVGLILVGVVGALLALVIIQR
jgi:hypothetical protein